MSFKNEFNQLAGKIVHVAELEAKLEQSGDFDNPQLITQLEETMAANPSFESDNAELLEKFGNGVYFKATDIAELENVIDTAKDEASAAMTLALFSMTIDSSLYQEVQHMAQVLSLTLNNDKLLNDFVKAAEECTDYSGARDTLVPAQALAAVIQKFETKFGKGS